MSNKLVLIDGHSILNRAFYGVPELTNAAGLHTNAIYGFLNIMFKILEEEKPEYLAVAFDVHAKTFRHEMYEAYKGTRKPMPEELREQVPVMKEVLKAMGIMIFEQSGLEADDILGTLAKKAEKQGMEVSLVSGDRDLLQIATKQIKIRIPKTKMGKTEIADYYEEDVRAAYQVTPQQFIELKALMGDTADNIPGVPKIGEKTATTLMVEYGSIEEIYNHIEEITKKSVKETLLENRALADLSKKLATIKVDCDVEIVYENARACDFYTKEAYGLFKQLEFKQYLQRFEQKDDSSQAEVTKTFRLLANKDEFFTCITRAEKMDRVSILPIRQEDKLFGVSISLSEEETFFYALPQNGDQDGQLSLFAMPSEEPEILEALRRLSEKTKIYTFDVKWQYAFLQKENTDTYFDVLISSYLLNPLKSDYDLAAIAFEYLGMVIPGRVEVFGKKSYEMVLHEDAKKVTEVFCYEAYVIRTCTPILQKKLEEAGMLSLLYDIEMPLSLVLYDMEKEGVMVRRDELRTYGEELVSKIQELEKSIYKQADTEFNIQSPKQLGEVLFEKLQLPGGKKTKTGYSTAADVLEKLANEYPIVRDILEYRGLTKLKSTYADGLSNYIKEDSRIHTSFNQTITATGRISSTEPNLQNIPMRTELGRRIRKVFVPKEGCVLMDADYSQIELRILAHMSGDEQLIEAYRMNEDIHRITASKVFHTPFEEVTDLQRRNAKAVNFGIVYGISSFGLSQDLSITPKEAAIYIEQYFETYPKVKEFLHGLVEEAKETGYVKTLYGRRRPIPELASSNFMQRSFGERVAMNSPIQGTAADIMKIAMIHVWEELRKEGLRSRLILQVHDELVIETYEDEISVVQKILSESMKNAAKLAIELEVDLHIGNNWYEAK